MSDRVRFNVNLYSTRWGREDTYEFQLERKQMKIEGIGKHALCSWVENLDPTWSGHNDMIGNPLEKMLENDSIYPPSVFVMALVSAWKAWRDSELDDEQIQADIRELCEWLNKVTQSQPKTEFWRSIF